jgi:hypothetical protein
MYAVDLTGYTRLGIEGHPLIEHQLGKTLTELGCMAIASRMVVTAACVFVVDCQAGLLLQLDRNSAALLGSNTLDGPVPRYGGVTLGNGILWVVGFDNTVHGFAVRRGER